MRSDCAENNRIGGIYGLDINTVGEFSLRGCPLSSSLRPKFVTWSKKGRQMLCGPSSVVRDVRWVNMKHNNSVENFK